MSKIELNNLSIKFRAYHNANPTFKEFFLNLFRKKKLSDHDDFWALKNISVVFNSGDFVGIIGDNGAGKSTLLKTLCGVYQPSSGMSRIEGRLAPLLEIGAGFHPEFTGRENIYLNGAILGFTKKELKKIEPEVIEFAEIEDFIDTPVKYYSTGMYMRLAFSLATSMMPNILVLDEVFNGGDASFLIKAKKRMAELIHCSDIMVLVSHDHELIKLLCNRVIWLDHGKLIQDGSPELVIREYLKFKAYN
jgi:ABC-type polysaccharide/polyol phosphate transport system ATPase subunit